MKLPKPVAITWLDASIDSGFDGHLEQIEDVDPSTQHVTTYGLLVRVSKTNYILATDVSHDPQGRPSYRTLTRIPRKLIFSVATWPGQPASSTAKATSRSLRA